MLYGAQGGFEAGGDGLGMAAGQRVGIPQFDEVGAGDDADDTAGRFDDRDLAPVGVNHHLTQGGNGRVRPHADLAGAHETRDRLVAKFVVERAIDFAAGENAEQLFVAVGVGAQHGEAFMAVAAHEFGGGGNGHVGGDALGPPGAHDFLDGDCGAALFLEQGDDAVAHAGDALAAVADGRGGGAHMAAAAQRAGNFAHIHFIGGAARDDLEDVAQVNDHEDGVGFVEVAQAGGERAEFFAEAGGFGRGDDDCVAVNVDKFAVVEQRLQDGALGLAQGVVEELVDDLEVDLVAWFHEPGQGARVPVGGGGIG